MTSFAIRLTSVEMSRGASLVARLATAVLVVLSSIGLLSTPLGDYDDSILLMGARLVRAGHLPYLDFYSHYGPFGYNLLVPLLGVVGSPAFSLRIGQAALLAIVAVAAHLLTRRGSSAATGGNEGAVPFTVLGLSTLAGFPSFFGFAFGLISLALFISAHNIRSKAWGNVVASLGGVALSAATLIRPAFGVYVGGAVLLVEGMLLRFRSSTDPPISTRFVSLLVAVLASGLLLWLLLYREIPPSVVFEAAVRGPAHLLAGGGRYLEPDFLRGGLLHAFIGGATITGTNLLWAFAVPTSRTRYLALLLLAMAALLPVLIRFALPTQPLSWLGFVFLPFPLLLAFSERRTLRESSDLGGAVLMATAAATFGHYAWTRADAPHLLPSLGLAAFGMALVWKRFRWAGRLAITGLFFLAYQAASRHWGQPVLPISRLWQAGAVAEERHNEVTPQTRWRCEEVRSDFAQAVALADSSADPRSRFVAIASSHVATHANPVILFLISERLPYTKWFQYDPGVQSSPSIQKEMERDLLASRSDTAVVWPARHFMVDRRRPSFKELLKKSELDLFFDRLYPETISRFGDYEVRKRVAAPPARPPVR